jgi:hypothetical protein
MQQTKFRAKCRTTYEVKAKDQQKKSKENLFAQKTKDIFVCLFLPG